MGGAAWSGGRVKESAADSHTGSWPEGGAVLSNGAGGRSPRGSIIWRSV